jgi:hypothetical protein
MTDGKPTRADLTPNERSVFYDLRRRFPDAPENELIYEIVNLVHVSAVRPKKPAPEER